MPISSIPFGMIDEYATRNSNIMDPALRALTAPPRPPGESEEIPDAAFEQYLNKKILTAAKNSQTETMSADPLTRKITGIIASDPTLTKLHPKGEREGAWFSEMAAAPMTRGLGGAGVRAARTLLNPTKGAAGFSAVGQFLNGTPETNSADELAITKIKQKLLKGYSGSWKDRNAMLAYILGGN
jgi:ABC-type branched-subunit amino acid transport system substrate-binding protein